MGEALCQCGHAKSMHTEFMPRNKCHGRDSIKAAYIGCDCTLFDPTPPPTREPIRLTDEAEEAAWIAYLDGDADDGYHDAEKPVFLAGFRAARLAGGPTLADAFRERLLTLKQDPDWQGLIVQQAIGVLGKHLDFLARTPESEDTE